MNQRRIVRVRDAMRTRFDVVDGTITVREALKSLRHAETKALIVNKRHQDDEYGMVLISDIGRQVLARDRSPDRVNVYEVMTKPVLSVPPDMDVRYCARLFERYRLARAPVIEEGEVLGIVSFTDLVIHGLMEP
ncbi:MAG TPA: CBS domain-containing protein [Gammaproteobacteria bacterium]|nr:CBS domain-containing protein [Gammaproteobacteria bacterium]